MARDVGSIPVLGTIIPTCITRHTTATCNIHEGTQYMSAISKGLITVRAGMPGRTCTLLRPLRAWISAVVVLFYNVSDVRLVLGVWWFLLCIFLLGKYCCLINLS